MDGGDADRAELLRGAQALGGGGKGPPGVRTAEEIKAAYGRKRWGPFSLPLRIDDLQLQDLIDA